MLYNDDNRGDMPDIAADVESPITRREVEHALRGMPENKSPGPDGITTEMLVAAGEVGILELTELSNTIHNQGSFPSELIKSIFITLPKVNETIKCEKHQTISLMSHVTKLVLRIVINRIRGRTFDRLHRYSMASCQINEQKMQYLCYGGSWKDQLRSRQMYTLVSLIIAKRLTL